MNDTEINEKLDDIKRLTPLILATILDIAHRSEELARLHATLKGQQPTRGAGVFGRRHGRGRDER